MIAQSAVECRQVLTAGIRDRHRRRPRDADEVGRGGDGSRPGYPARRTASAVPALQPALGRSRPRREAASGCSSPSRSSRRRADRSPSVQRRGRARRFGSRFPLRHDVGRNRPHRSTRPPRCGSCSSTTTPISGSSSSGCSRNAASVTSRKQPTRNDGLRLASSVGPHLILLDLAMPGGTGIDVLPDLRTAAAEAAIVVLSNMPRQRLLGEVLRRGAVGFVEKAIPPNRLVDEILIAAALTDLARTHVLELASASTSPGRGRRFTERAAGGCRSTGRRRHRAAWSAS